MQSTLRILYVCSTGLCPLYVEAENGGEPPLVGDPLRILRILRVSDAASEKKNQNKRIKILPTGEGFLYVEYVETGPDSASFGASWPLRVDVITP